MSKEVSNEALSSLVKDAVTDALKISELECPDCQAKFQEPARYMDHRIGEYMEKKIKDVKAPDPEKLILSCKDGICKMISEHVEKTYDMTKKGEAVKKPPGEEVVKGLWDDIEEKETEKK